MHHLYPLAKGDPLCPLGFHPQVRWPTRCKRCFRDYKEHGGKKRDGETNLAKDASTVSTPSLSWNSGDLESKRNWVSSSNLSTEAAVKNDSNDFGGVPSSWISTPDLANMQDDTQPVTTVNITLPKRKQKPIEAGHRTVSDSFSVVKTKHTSAVFNRNDSLATRAKKLQAIKESTPEKGKRIQIKEVKTISDESTNHDVKPKPSKELPHYSSHENSDDDTISLAGTDTTDTTLVNSMDNELRDQLESLKTELDTTKAKCERLEREKSDILLRRLAAMETSTSKTAASEVLKLQQKCNELQQSLEDYRDEKKSLSLKVKELEDDLSNRPTPQQAQKVADELRSKLLAAETLCEELMDENEDIKKELRDMEEQMDEIQDNFRDDQAIAYTSLKKDLDQTTKNCRILSFKLRKSERKTVQLDTEKQELEKQLKDISGSGTTLNQIERNKQLEQELKLANEVSLRLQKELEEAKEKISKAEDSKGPNKKKAPLLGSIGKSPSAEGKKVSRESLTRGGSQDDPAQLLRDLQDSLEREADLREQLKFSEEEAQTLRKKVSRIEDENESLVLQVKKMASRARTRKLSPTNQRLTPEPQEKSELLDDDDLAEIKLQLELSEQEASVLRNKVEELETDNHKLRAKVKDIQEQTVTKVATRISVVGNDDENSLLIQKLKVLEDETNEIRKKLIEKERDCERLHAELSVTQKKSKGIQKSKSLDLDQQTLDLRRQLQVIDQEASVLRNKVQSLETENEKVIAENKRLSLLRGTKSTKLDRNKDKFIDQIATLEVELAEKNEKIQELEKIFSTSGTKLAELKGDLKKLTQRTPKRVTALTSKEQLKMMVEDLEKEISEMVFFIKLTETSKAKLEEEYNSKLQKTTKDLDDLSKKYDSFKKDFEEEKARFKKELKMKEESLQKTKESLTKAKDSLEKSNNEKLSLQDQIDKLNKDITRLGDEKKISDEEVGKLKANLKLSNARQTELNTISQKVETLKLALENKDKEYKKIKEEHTKLSEEVSVKSKKLNDLEIQLTKFENKCNEGDKKLQELMKNSEIENVKNKQIIKNLEMDQVKWGDDRKKLNIQIETLTAKIKGLETTVEQKDELVKQLEDSLAKEREMVSKTNLKVDVLENREISKLKDALSKSKVHLSEMESKLEIANKSNKNLEDKLSKTQLEIKNSKLENEKKLKELEINLQNEKKKQEVLKNTSEKENKNKELELGVLRDKIKKLEHNTSTSPDMKKLQTSIEKLETNLNKETKKYDELTAKYEILEEEHVVTKAKLVMEKEILESQNKNSNQELEKLATELRTLRDTYNTHQDKWIKEKLHLEEKMKESNRLSYNGSESNRQRLKALLEEKQSEFEQLKKEYVVIHDQMEFMRRENDDLKKKLDDYEKVNKIQRNISADSSAMEKEIKQLRLRVNSVEKSRKTDLAELKMRYESQINIVNGELQSLQNQVLRFKREKDTYKHMLESAQKTIGELKQNPVAAKEGPKNYDEMEEFKHKIATLEQQISCMEDELSESRLESSRLKTELVSERSSWEVKLSELHSKVNELEEEKVLNSGRTKIVGLRTRMELAWQKEREEQQRLLQETATLARDLRQTLFEVERERDKERLEAKRKQEQFKKTTEEEQEENKKKITELQYDLLELRDAHAKLRTTNEKLRREKERFDKDKEEHRLSYNGKRKSDYEDERKINTLVEQMDTLKQLAPELFFSKENESPYTPTPPRRTKSKSRETSPAIEGRETYLSTEEKEQQIQQIMQRLVHTTEDLRKIQRASDDDYDRERMLRLGGTRRATSSEHDTLPTSRYGVVRKPSISSLKRKSISLEQTTHIEQKIWTNDNSMTSLNSLELHSDIETGRSRRDASLDSRLSNGSTQSEIGDKKKKKGLMGRLKKLTKSRSIDDQDPGTFSPTRALSSKTNSQTDSTEDTRGSRKDLKERLTSIFKKSGSSSRSNSVERRHETSSTQRPLVRTGSNTLLTQSSTEAESARQRTKRS